MYTTLAIATPWTAATAWHEANAMPHISDIPSAFSEAMRRLATVALKHPQGLADNLDLTQCPNLLRALPDGGSRLALLMYVESACRHQLDQPHFHWPAAAIERCLQPDCENDADVLMRFVNDELYSLSLREELLLRAIDLKDMGAQVFSTFAATESSLRDIALLWVAREWDEPPGMYHPSVLPQLLEIVLGRRVTKAYASGQELLDMYFPQASEVWPVAGTLEMPLSQVYETAMRADDNKPAQALPDMMNSLE